MGNKGATEIKVGIFVFFGILALLVLTIRLAQEAFTPKDSYKLYAVFDSVSGLIKGAKIEMAGVPIGKVGEISLTPEGKAKVELLIYKKYKIQQDATAVVRTFGVLGDKYIEIRPGTSQAFLSEGGLIAKTESPVDLDQILASIGPTVEGLKEVLGTQEGKENLKILVANIKDASESFKKIAEKVEKGQGTLGKLITDDRLYKDLTEIAKNLRLIAEKVEKGEGTLGKLVKDETLYNNLKNTASNLERVSKRLERGEGTLGKLINDDELYKDLKSLSKDLKNAAANLDKIVARIEKGEGTLGKLLKDETLYTEVKKTLKSVNRAAKGVEEQVPISVLGTVAGAAMK
ncbi:MAG: mammalian cell entry protein [Caldimicrobium thiodismutans]|uniref:Mammalian cell entry protein n=1 Tax=Caldimicrobium thiodismutans TaxID=1653476 RepID=A0A2N7PKG0_9BACT|nr:MAG: mammalian cell entry protein [Caldimicrobium thiodismutans]